MRIESYHERQNPAWEHLFARTGELFIQFARCEGFLSLMLKMHMARNFSGDDQKLWGVANAVYGGMRFSAARDMFKRIWRVESPEDDKFEFMTGVFQHVGQIQELRDKLAHQHLVATSPPSTWWFVTEYWTNKDPSDIGMVRFSTEMLEAAADDLEQVYRIVGKFGAAGTTTLASGITDVSPVPWRYKPSMLARHRQKKASSPQEPSPPPQS